MDMKRMWVKDNDHVMFFIWWSGKEEDGCCLVTSYKSTLMQYTYSRIQHHSLAILNYLWVELRKIHDNVKRMTEHWIYYWNLWLWLVDMSAKKLNKLANYLHYSHYYARRARLESMPAHHQMQSIENHLFNLFNIRLWFWGLQLYFLPYQFYAISHIHIHIHGMELALWSFNSRKIGILPIKWSSWDGNFENDYHAMVFTVQ